jgi:hypothetical protein
VFAAGALLGASFALGLAGGLAGALDQDLDFPADQRLFALLADFALNRE